ncbi:family A G protein-coupled receptor-like protein [Calocera viscosa TUFC12733]|uniref:Family A G protein-coupled receptor-like protein n=1 Tax=Calocera viscosa (strain TUFC12733) TaxID=1330018 RepID=A0A167J0Y5_CALVF|nr:family A G protein-coupled receptor-like protein [Calocera viscosa TUFC12733]
MAVTVSSAAYWPMPAGLAAHVGAEFSAVGPEAAHKRSPQFCLSLTSPSHTPAGSPTSTKHQRQWLSTRLGGHAACGQRVFHLLSIVILATAAIACFSMASDLGGTPVQAEFFGNRHQTQGQTRTIWSYSRVLILVHSDIFITVFMDIAMIVAGLVGALVPSTYKWGYFAGGMAALFFIYAELIGPDVRGIFRCSAVFLSFLWLLYPIAWGLSDGSNVSHPDSKMVFYGILDILAKPVYIFVHIASLRGVDMSRFGLTGIGVGGISAVQGTRTGGFFNEKPGANPAGAAPVNRQWMLSLMILREVASARWTTRF